MTAPATLTPRSDTHADAATERRQILFLGTHGQANIGDELLLDTFVRTLGPRHRWVVNSYDPAATTTQLRDRVEATVFDTAGSRVELLRHVRRADVVVFGGGNIVKELYRSTGRWRYSTLLMILGVVLAARVLGTPVLMSNVGVGPVTTRAGRLLAAAVLALVDLVSVRDAGSYDTCRTLGVDPARVRLVPDAVWARDAASLRDDAATPTAADDGILRVALNLNRDVEAADDWDVFQQRIVEAIDLLAADGEVEVHALPMQSSFKAHTDLEVLEDVAARVGPRTVVHRPTDPAEVAAIIDACDVVVSERLHAIVMASILGTPVVALPYDVKVKALVDQLDLGDRAFPADAGLDPVALAASIRRAAADADEPARLDAVAEELRGRAREHAADVRAWIDAPRREWPATGEP